jgi:hypothetical protein
MYTIKTNKKIYGGDSLGKSRIDGTPMYKFDSYIEFRMQNPEILEKDYREIAVLEDAPKSKIEEIYDLSVKLYYEVADDHMKASGHPGVMGTEGDAFDIFAPEYGKLMGAIETLKQVAEKIKYERK